MNNLFKAVLGFNVLMSLLVGFLGWGGYETLYGGVKVFAGAFVFLSLIELWFFAFERFVIRPLHRHDS